MLKTSYKILIGLGVFILLPFWLSRFTFAVNVRDYCGFNGGTVCTNVSDDLPQGATGINPNQTVRLSFSVYEKNTGNPPSCQAGRQLFNVVRHYIAGSATNYEYLSAGSGQDKDYTFNSGTNQQINRYVGVFYCWTSSQGTSKSALDLLLGTLGTQGQTWSSPEFNLTTRAATIDPNCAMITNCSQYPVQNDCVANRCNLDPPCRWTGSTCVVQTTSSGGETATNYNFSLRPPTGIETFQDLVNVIGRWVFNLSIPIAVIMIIWAGVLMLTSGGKPDQFRKGMTALKWAVIGLAIVLIGKGFVSLIKSILDLRNS